MGRSINVLAVGRPMAPAFKVGNKIGVFRIVKYLGHMPLPKELAVGMIRNEHTYEVECSQCGTTYVFFQSKLRAQIDRKRCNGCPLLKRANAKTSKPADAAQPQVVAGWGPVMQTTRSVGPSLHEKTFEEARNATQKPVK